MSSRELSRKELSRKEDRAHAFSLVFQLPHIDGGDFGNVAENYFEGLENGRKGVDVKFVEAIFEGVVSRLCEIDRTITACLTAGWDINRLAAADLAILRLAVFELLFYGKTPPKVAVNEAVELAKAYSTNEAPKFVNGVLRGVLERKEE